MNRQIFFFAFCSSFVFVNYYLNRLIRLCLCVKYSTLEIHELHALNFVFSFYTERMLYKNFMVFMVHVVWVFLVFIRVGETTDYTFGWINNHFYHSITVPIKDSLRRPYTNTHPVGCLFNVQIQFWSIYLFQFHTKNIQMNSKSNKRTPHPN